MLGEQRRRAAESLILRQVWEEPEGIAAGLVVEAMTEDIAGRARNLWHVIVAAELVQVRSLWGAKSIDRLEKPLVRRWLS